MGSMFLYNEERGITLVEVIVVVALIVIFSSILIADFPNIQKQFYLTRASYRLAQDLRRAQDLSLSGAFAKDDQGNDIAIAGYGIYLDPNQNDREYTVYADSCQPFDSQYTPPNELCADGDHIVSTVDLRDEGKEIFIKEFTNLDADSTSINFTPPNPRVTIQNICAGCKEVSIVLALDSQPSQTKSILVNTAGLITVP